MIPAPGFDGVNSDMTRTRGYRVNIMKLYMMDCLLVC